MEVPVSDVEDVQPCGTQEAGLGVAAEVELNTQQQTMTATAKRVSEDDEELEDAISVQEKTR